MQNRIAPVAAALALLAAQPASAIVITATQDTSQLINALLAGGNTGIIVRGVTLNGHRDDFNLTGGTVSFLSSGTYTNAAGTYGIGSGVVLSTGSVNAVDAGDDGDGLELFAPGYGTGPNTSDSTGWSFGDIGQPATSAQELLLDPITGRGIEDYDHFDVTELLIEFDMEAGFSEIRFGVVFGSEEFAEFVGSEFVDGFGMFLNGANIAFLSGMPVNINHPDMQFLGGTELDGVLAPGNVPLLVFGGSVNPTGNTLRFIVADTSDPIYDTTVYFSSLAGVGVVPAPPAVWLLGTAVAAFGGRRLLRRRSAMA